MTILPAAVRRWLQPTSRRAAVLLLVAAIHILLLLALLSISNVPKMFGTPGGPITVTLLPDAPPEPEQRRAARARRPAGGRPETQAAPTAPPEKPAVDLSEQSAAATWSKVLSLNRTEMAASDVGRIAPAARGDRAGDPRADGAPGDSDVTGSGPNGEPLYAAEWYRRPTSAELSTYMPAARPEEGWGMVACRTVADYRVEDCVEIGQSPPGSGLSRAVRQAAWQFRVRPPRKGGKPLVGAWVSIRIEYTLRRASAE